jgi:hypothetical protein
MQAAKEKATLHGPALSYQVISLLRGASQVETGYKVHRLSHYNVVTIDDGCQSSSISDTIVNIAEP